MNQATIDAILAKAAERRENVAPMLKGDCTWSDDTLEVVPQGGFWGYRIAVVDYLAK